MSFDDLPTDTFWKGMFHGFWLVYAVIQRGAKGGGPSKDTSTKRIYELWEGTKNMRKWGYSIFEKRNLLEKCDGQKDNERRRQTETRTDGCKT